MGKQVAKRAAYRKLVGRRKACRACKELINPSVVDGGRYDCDHVGPWSAWQGDLEAEVIVIGQDWGDVGYFLKFGGLDEPGDKNPTNKHLCHLLRSIGFRIEPPQSADSRQGPRSVFVTNAILCLKREGGLQGKVRREWFNNCGSRFLKPSIEIVRPRVLVTMGERALRAVLDAYGLPAMKLSEAVGLPRPVFLPNGAALFAVYHCGAWGLTVRPLDKQEKDWKRVGRYLGMRRALRAKGRAVPASSRMSASWTLTAGAGGSRAGRQGR